jgi:hypothetical protein
MLVDGGTIVNLMM